jgi:hypothetical protein
MRNPPMQGRLPTDSPTAPQLVKYLNDNAARLQSLECRDLWIAAKQGGQAIDMPGLMVCQKPRNFRLNAKAVGNPAVDLGSNQNEFWYWINKSDPPYLFHCAYQDLADGKARAMPFPFQPEWVMEALGMATYDPAGDYEVRNSQNTIELIQKTRSPQGQPIRKVTVFNRQATRSGQPVVAAYALQDANGKTICTATVNEVKTDRNSGATVPLQVHLSWPQQQIDLKMKFDNLIVNQLASERASALFTRPLMPNTPSYDLARGLDQPTGQVERTSGVMR